MTLDSGRQAKAMTAAPPASVLPRRQGKYQKEGGGQQQEIKQDEHVQPLVEPSQVGQGRAEKGGNVPLVIQDAGIGIAVDIAQWRITETVGTHQRPLLSRTKEIDHGQEQTEILRPAVKKRRHPTGRKTADAIMALRQHR